MRTETLLEVLHQVPDPRLRQGRRYALPEMLACLLLAALNGETSLRGMWLWACQNAAWLCPKLFWDTGTIPALNTFWRTLIWIDERKLLQAVNKWLGLWGERRIAIDGKTLRGSKRKDTAALQVLTAAGQEMKVVLDQVRVEGEDEVAAALRLLELLPVAGKVVTLDAGLMDRPVVKRVVEKGGPTWAR